MSTTSATLASSDSKSRPSGVVSVPMFASSSNSSSAVTRMLKKRKRSSSTSAAAEERVGKRVCVEEVTDDNDGSSSSSSSTAIVPAAAASSQSRAIALSREDQALRDTRKKAIKDYCKTWLDKTKEGLERQRSLEARRETMQQEKAALQACVKRVNDASHGITDVHDVVSLMQMIMKYYQKHHRNVKRIETYEINKRKVLKEGRKQFLREMYNIAKEKSKDMVWPSEECAEEFERYMRAAFEKGEQSKEQHRMRLLESIAREMKAWREKIITDYNERKAEQEREAARRRAMAAITCASSSSSTAAAAAPTMISPFDRPISAPIYQPSVPMPFIVPSRGGGSMASSSNITFTYHSVSISFTHFVANGAGYNG